MGKIIAVGNLKGGTGKSTIAVNLACGLAERQRSVALIDADPQGTASGMATGRASAGAGSSLPAACGPGRRCHVGRPDHWAAPAPGFGGDRSAAADGEMLRGGVADHGSSDRPAYAFRGGSARDRAGAGGTASRAGGARWAPALSLGTQQGGPTHLGGTAGARVPGEARAGRWGRPWASGRRTATPSRRPSGSARMLPALPRTWRCMRWSAPWKTSLPGAGSRPTITRPLLSTPQPPCQRRPGSSVAPAPRSGSVRSASVSWERCCPSCGPASNRRSTEPRVRHETGPPAFVRSGWRRATGTCRWQERGGHQAPATSREHTGDSHPAARPGTPRDGSCIHEPGPLGADSRSRETVTRSHLPSWRDGQAAAISLHQLLVPGTLASRNAEGSPSREH